MNESTLVSFGGSVKALGDGRVGGYLVRFSTANDPDLSATKDYFTAQTGFGLEDSTSSAVYYAHCLDPQLKTRKIGRGTMKADDAGVWLEAQLSLRDEYEKHIYDLAQKGKLGWSSGTAAHLVTRKAVETPNGTAHEILTWPLGLDASLTPTPAEPRNDVVALKSLGALIGMEEPSAAKPAATKSRADFTYDDLRSLLEQEWNEDFGMAGMGDLYGDSWARQWHIVAMDDTTAVAQQGWHGELCRRAYTVTAGNDVTWGDPEEVARTTGFVAVTDSEDAGAIKEIDTIIPPAGMSFDTQIDAALAAVDGVIVRGTDINDLRIKSGRVLSAANRSKLADLHGKMHETHGQMTAHMAALSDLLDKTNPDAKKDADEVGALRTQFLRLQSRHLGLTV